MQRTGIPVREPVLGQMYGSVPGKRKRGNPNHIFADFLYGKTGAFVIKSANGDVHYQQIWRRSVENDQ